MRLCDFKPYITDDVVLYELKYSDALKTEYEPFRDVYKGRMEDAPLELLLREVLSFGAVKENLLEFELRVI